MVIGIRMTGNGNRKEKHTSLFSNDFFFALAINIKAEIKINVNGCR